jgi:hypothetical protein
MGGFIEFIKAVDLLVVGSAVYQLRKGQYPSHRPHAIAVKSGSLYSLSEVAGEGSKGHQGDDRRTQRRLAYVAESNYVRPARQRPQHLRYPA